MRESERVKKIPLLLLFVCFCFSLILLSISSQNGDCQSLNMVMMVISITPFQKCTLFVHSYISLEGELILKLLTFYTACTQHLGSSDLYESFSPCVFHSQYRVAIFICVSVISSDKIHSVCSRLTV